MPKGRQSLLKKAEIYAGFFCIGVSLMSFISRNFSTIPIVVFLIGALLLTHIALTSRK